MGGTAWWLLLMSPETNQLTNGTNYQLMNGTNQPADQLTNYIHLSR